MEAPARGRVEAAAAMRDGFVTLTKPPFRGLLLLAVLVALVSSAVPQEGQTAELLATLVLIAASLYLQIAVTLAAAAPDASLSVDVWLKRALARRCFWRYVGASILVVLMVVVCGIVGLVVGAFLIGGVVSLVDPAVVLEGHGPTGAVARSSEVGKGSLRPLIVIFGLLVLLPGIAIEAGALVWDLEAATGDFWPVVPVLGLVLGFAGTIALTRAFVALGGRREPARPASLERGE